ncbi:MULTISPECIES: efflux transporter outer membrane subunit [Duganella]|uniref:efflux transporter outer membrane subunit n=1 Tax=Duganella TaxID=75654 RepID=UPI0030EAC085
MTSPATARALGACAALLLGACSAPQFRQPELAAPDAYKEAAHRESAPALTLPDGSRWEASQPAASQPDGAWWRVFNDAQLDRLIAEATAANQNLAGAAARLRQARAIAGIAEAQRMPQLDAGIGAQRVRQSPLELGLPAGSPVAPASIYQARLTASYEADLFGRVSSSVAAARGDAAASAAIYRAVLLSLQADVAQTWFRLRETDAELAALAEAVGLREKSLAVNQRRYDLGDIGEFDLVRARTELSTARAEAIGLQQQRAVNEHALAVLLGRPAGGYSVPVQPLGVAAPPVVPPGLPSSLLQRRPDLAAAQRQMEAANARIGVARAARFPALLLNAGGGGEAATFADVFKWSSRSWLAGAALSMPLIDGGRNRSNIARSEAALEEAVAAFRQQVLAAYADVEDNLAGLRILGAQSQQIGEALVSARRSAELAQKLYGAGRSSYLDLLDAQRNLTTVQRQAAQLNGSRAVATVALIRALGGGWQDAPAALAAN